MRAVLPLVLIPVLLYGQNPASNPAETPRIEDNSFLMEEAYNQEYGVVQHIQTFSRDFRSRDYVYTFTQEWPIDLDPRHQFSYTLQGVHTADFDGAGWGDTFLNYRYQLFQGDKLAIAPRASLILPSGNSRRDHGYGATGFETNWAFSYRVGSRLVSHSNAGWTLVPGAKSLDGNRAKVNDFFLGQSFVWLAKPRFNVLLETVYDASEKVIAEGTTQRAHDVIMNPGIRWSYNLKNGAQIVPGVSVPIGVGPGSREVGILVYFSIEHSYRKQRNARK